MECFLEVERCLGEVCDRELEAELGAKGELVRELELVEAEVSGGVGG